MATRIMVIDDEPLIGQLLRYQLSGHGYEVTVFQDSHAALMQLAYEPPDLVVLDVMMPGMSGWDVCRQIRLSSQVPILMLTAKNADDDVVTGLTLGADDYMCKPFSEAQLLARVTALLRRSGTPVPQVEPSQNKPVRPVQPPRLPQQTAYAPRRFEPVQTTATAQPRLGALLAAGRRARGLSLHDAEQRCGVRWEFLQALEGEQFDYLPRAQLRSSLRAYSEFLQVDLKPYIKRNAPQRRPALPTSLALALVIAMICLFTFVLIAL